MSDVKRVEKSGMAMERKKCALLFKNKVCYAVQHLPSALRPFLQSNNTRPRYFASISIYRAHCTL